MKKYWCYRKYPERITVGGYCSFPSSKHYMTYDEWEKEGKPTDEGIHFMHTMDEQPPQLKKYWENRRKASQSNTL